MNLWPRITTDFVFKTTSTYNIRMDVSSPIFLLKPKFEHSILDSVFVFCFFVAVKSAEKRSHLSSVILLCSTIYSYNFALQCRLGEKNLCLSAREFNILFPVHYIFHRRFCCRTILFDNNSKVTRNVTLEV